MVDNTSTLVSTGVIADNTKPMGYYIDLGSETGSPYRINVDMVSSAGVVAFIGNSLGGDACNPTGNYEVFAVTYGGGKSVILDGGVIVANIKGSGTGTVLVPERPDGDPANTGIIFGDNNGKGKLIKIDQPSSTGFKLLNWRELPSSD